MAKSVDRGRQSASRRQRREEMQRRQAQQNRVITIVAALLIVAIVAFAVWQLWPEPEEEGSESGAGEVISGERPLAEMAPSARNAFYDQVPETVIDVEGKEYEAVIRTEKGEIRLELFDEEAPLTVNNFVFLANQGFYDGTSFHRVLEGFMAQGGDPTGTGTGGPGYQFEDETDNGLAFDRRGLLAMANAGPGTNGSQFFITFGPTEHLTGRHTIFGEVIEGESVLDELTIRDPEALPADAPAGDLIERIDIFESDQS
jgi:cyclophilin family peptidyl-prolyl cis-trans isomerase